MNDKFLCVVPHLAKMQNVAMDEAVRLLGAELGKMTENVAMGRYVSLLQQWKVV